MLKKISILLFAFLIGIETVSASNLNTVSGERIVATIPSGMLTSVWHRIDRIDLLDSRTDTSLYRFVSRNAPLTSKSYEPSPLLSISGANINEAGRKSMLRADARDALWKMGDAFFQEFGGPLVVVSGYRSAAYQQRLWDLGRCTDSLCAPPGQSEHQLGLAVDLFDASTEKDFASNPRYMRYVRWLQSHAHLYGWTQSYQKGEKVDGYEVEPWHWRYIGVEMATRLHNLGWSYTEYMQVKNLLERY